MGFASWLRYCTDVSQRRSTKLCTMFGRLLRWYILYIQFLGLLSPNGILPGAKFTLRPSFAFSYIGSITARHSGSGREPNFASWYKNRITKLSLLVIFKRTTYIPGTAITLGIGAHSIVASEMYCDIIADFGEHSTLCYR